MKFSELITKLHSASQPHMLMYIDIRSDCELADVNILASGQSDVQAGTLYFADAGQLAPDTVLPTNLLYYGTLPPELADRLTNSATTRRCPRPRRKTSMWTTRCGCGASSRDTAAIF